jgi:hypothetical protein
MKIRSITYFCHPRYPLDQAVLGRAGTFLRDARAAFEAAGYQVQTTRLATIPFPRLLGEKNLYALPALARELDLLIKQIEVGYACLGPAVPGMPPSYEVIPEAIAATQNVFFGGIMAERRTGIDPQALHACAQIIAKCSAIDPHGFANLRFAALANVPADSPFFPAAYHQGAGPAFAIATEAADLAVDAFTAAATVERGRALLINAIEAHGRELARVAGSLAARAASRSGVSKGRGPSFLGIDFSLAPFPSEAISLGTAFERLGVPRAGLHGSLAAAAILTEAIDRARFPRTGFSGLLLPVLEDATLSRRAADGSLTVKDLLLYSAVCGTGLDTIPLPGDTTPAQLTPLLLDLSALALRLGKPLTARLMPIPNKKAGDATGFDFAFFANSRVMALDSEPLGGPLSGSESFTLRPR